MYDEGFVSQYPYKAVGDLTTVQAALGTDKSEATTHALTATGIAKLQLEPGTQAMLLRFLCSADADSNVINVYGKFGSGDHYQIEGTYTLTGGKQVDGDVGVFVDTIAESGTTEVWPSGNVVSSDANDSIATLAFKTHGCSDLLIIATTLASAKLRVEAARITL